MKKKSLYLIFFLLFFSCNKKYNENQFFQCDEQMDDCKYLSFITAGQTHGNGIWYSKINPFDPISQCDNYCNSDTLSIDLDMDKNNDFIIKYIISDWQLQSVSFASLEIIPLKSNAVCVSKSSYNLVDSLILCVTIGYNNNWFDSTAILFSYSTRYFTPLGEVTESKGYWKKDCKYYIGIRISQGENFLYGWLNIQLPIIKQYGISVPY
jgi:hypothetical protein